MGEDLLLKTFIVQFFQKTETSDDLISSLKYFMFDDKKNPIYLHVCENTLFIYTAHEYWNMNSLAMLIRSHLKGDFFLIHEVDSYDGLLPSSVWDKKADAKKYYNDKASVLNKYKRGYVLEKVSKRSFLKDIGNVEPTVEDTYKVIVDEEVKEIPMKKLSKKKTN